MIQIKPNNYVQPTEVREEVVQAICDAFLGVNGDGTDTSGCHIFNTKGLNRDEQPTIYVAHHLERSDYSCFRDKEKIDEIIKRENHRYAIYRIYGCEMKQAFAELQKAGYFMFGQMSCTGVHSYRCYCKPYLEGWGRVDEFNIFID